VAKKTTGKKAGGSPRSGSKKARAAEATPRGSTDYRRRPQPMEADFPGTPLSSQDFREGVITWSDEYTVEYAWDAGVAIGAYLDGLKAGKLLASYSPGTGRTVVPPRTFDELSWTPIDDLRELPGTGIVNTFSLCMVNWDASRRDEPLMPAVIELDGASPGMGILHMLGEVVPEDVEIGMAVEAVWKPAAERQGAITDIRYFRPRSRRGAKGARSEGGGKRSRPAAPGRRGSRGAGAKASASSSRRAAGGRDGGRR
jgi:uncharacterized OB-fold protein